MLKLATVEKLRAPAPDRLTATVAWGDDMYRVEEAKIDMVYVYVIYLWKGIDTELLGSFLDETAKFYYGGTRLANALTRFLDRSKTRDDSRDER